MTTNPNTNPLSRRVLALVVVAFVMGYFLSYILRDVNAVISPVLVDEFSLNATQIGLMTSVYFMMAALVLIPVAILLDRFGPSRIRLGLMTLTFLWFLTTREVWQNPNGQEVVA